MNDAEIRGVFTWAVVIFTTLLPVASMEAATVEQKDLILKRHPSSLLMTEDGKHLVAKDSNQGLIVIDPLEFKEIMSVEAPATGPILSRSGKLYVSQQDTGLVKIYSEENWALVNEVDTGVKPLITLSAKTGKNFDGILLASSHSVVHVVDVGKDSHRAIAQGSSMAQFSADGKHVIHIADSKYVAFGQADYVQGKTERPVFTSFGVGSVRSPLPYVDEFWLGAESGSIYVGLVPSSHMERLGQTLVPDSSPETRLLYAIRGNNIEVRRLDDACSLLDTVVLKEVINTYSGSLPCVRRNDDGSVTLFWLPSRIPGITSATFKVAPPVRANEVGTQKIKLPPADDSQLVTGPPGTSIANGWLLWKPPVNPSPGDHAFKIKQTTGDKVSFFRESITVMPADSSVSSDLIRLESDPGSQARLKSHASARGIAMIDDRRLLLFDVSGKLSRSIPLEKVYHDLALVSGGFALCTKEVVDLLDTTGKITKTMKLGAVELSHMAPGADGDVLYVSCKDPTEQELVKGFPIYRINLKSHEPRRLERAAGEGLLVNRAGDQLLTFVSHSQLQTVGFLKFIEENTDVIMNYQIVGDSVRMHHANGGIANGIQGLSSSPDGRYVALQAYGILSRGGMNYSRQVPVFAATNLEKPERIITVDEGGIRDVVYHPKLHQLFVLCYSKDSSKVECGISVYDADGGKLEGAVTEGAAIPADPEKMVFSPDGMSLLVSGRDIYGRRILKRFTLNLSDADKALCSKPTANPKPVFTQSIAGDGIGRGSKPTPGASGFADGLTPSQLGKLLIDPSTQRPLSPEEMGALRMPSVVVVDSGEHGIGAGFFVSSDGHILTAAHCLPDLGGTVVSHYIDMPFGKIEFKTPATVIDVDKELDLALIKINFNAPTLGLRLSNRESAVGSKVYAIGHPGVEDLSLDYTLTEGLVSSQVRKIEGRSQLQISAAVNPGNSGGPVLDGRGCVIGMVSQKAVLEGASFAVPAAIVNQFLAKSKAATDRAELDPEPMKNELRQKGWAPIDELGYQAEPQAGKQRAHIKGDPSKSFTGTLAMLGNPPDHVFFTSEYKDGYANGNNIVFDRQKKRISLTQYKNGEQEGLVIQYYPSGNVRDVRAVLEGKPHGFTREYYDKPMSVKEAVFFANGVQSGPAYAMDELGRVSAAVFYSEGKAVMQTAYNHRDQVEGVPIIEYTKAGDTEMLQELVKRGESINKLHGKKAPIHVAAQIKYIYLLKSIVELGGKVDEKDSDGKTALELVMSDTHPSIPIAKSLVDLGADKSVLTDAQRALLEK